MFIETPSWITKDLPRNASPFPQKADITMDASTIFISYSHHDRPWVWEWLLPRLEAAGLKVLIDDRDFTVGAAVLDNIEDAVEASRRTLLVLTPSWVASEWTSFESLLLQTGDPTGLRGRLLPLLLETCDPPKRLGIFTYADFRDPAGRDAALARLLRQITGGGQPALVGQPPALPNLVPSTLPPQPYFFGREAELADHRGRDLARGAHLGRAD